MCDNAANSPFCAPQDGAQLQTGETVNITWNPFFFTTSSSGTPPQIFIQADFSLTNNAVPETAGFTSSPLDPSTGFFSWPILATYIPAAANTTTALLSIAAPLSHAPTNGTFTRIGAGTIRFPGPQVRILRANTDTNTNTNTNNPALTNSNSNSNNPTLNNLTTPTPSSQPQTKTQDPGPNPLAIALPIIFGLLTALAMASYALLKRHRPDVLRRFTFTGPRFWWWRREPVAGDGYGERKLGQGREGQQQQQQRVRLRGRDVEIKVVKTDLEGLRANAGRMEMEMGMGMGRGGNNVFREEVGRQEVERGRF